MKRKEEMIEENYKTRLFKLKLKDSRALIVSSIFVNMIETNSWEKIVTRGIKTTFSQRMANLTQS